MKRITKQSFTTSFLYLSMVSGIVVGHMAQSAGDGITVFLLMIVLYSIFVSE